MTDVDLKLMMLLKILLITFSCLTLIGCGTSAIKKQQPFDYKDNGTILLSLESELNNLAPQSVVQQVSKNLSVWQYPITLQASNTDTHHLEVKIGRVTHGSTPTGFSFSAGDSDPRALEFQKADVLPISCSLSALKHPEQTSALTMGFTTDSRPQTSDKLIDHVATVCFNLLREVKWPTQAAHSEPQATGTQPSWFPEIRIEEARKPKAAKPAASSKPAQTPAAPNAKTEEPQLENAESNENSEEPQKDMIIHNQGSPVIIHFGHERL